MINNFFEDKITTSYIKDVTNGSNTPNINFGMFHAIIFKDGLTYSCERLNINGQNGLCFDDGKSKRLHGFDIEAEDPRLISINNKIYVIFICKSKLENQDRGIAITEFDNFNPIQLKIKNIPNNFIEKNWAPFVKNNILYFVYNYDPLIILSYDFNLNGECEVEFLEENTSLPFNVNDEIVLRGGSNLIPYKDNLYIGGCHSRVRRNHSSMVHFTHIVLLDTLDWKIKFISKPLKYYYDCNKSFNLKDTNILYQKTLNIVQDPISLNKIDDKFLLTINFSDDMSFLYELGVKELPLEDFKPQDGLNYINKKCFELINFVDKNNLK